MGWRRLPTLLAHIPLRTQPLSEKQKTLLEQTDHLPEIVLKTIPSVGKLEVKHFLESVYGLNVARVRTANFTGLKKRDQKTGTFYRTPDWKKVYVSLRHPQQSPGTSL